MKRPFHHIAVLKGGPSSEREISLRSGAAVASGLRDAGYDVTEVDITKPCLDLPAGIEAVFIALHGTFGEDGQVQALLEERGIPYTGSGPEASRRAFDKVLSKQAFEAAGVPTPEYAIAKDRTLPTLALPFVVKPACEGSTIGIHRVNDATAWPAAYRDAASYGSAVMAERYIPGREITVGIVGEQALPAVEIEAPDDWYDYDAKYDSQKTRYRVPAPLTPVEAEQCATFALAAHRVLNCRGLSRVDFRRSPDGIPYVLEINTIPGFTATSLLPKAAAAAGISFAQLCDRIMRLAQCDEA